MSAPGSPDEPPTDGALADCVLAAGARGDTHDPAHDLAHVRRVVATARRLAQEEGADREVVRLAAWLHDLAAVPKDSPQRAQASRLSAEQAEVFLRQHGVDETRRQQVAHAIEAHSYSAGVPARSLEAKVVQDADRLDALGAIGLARCFSVGAQLGRSLYAPEDPFCRDRLPDDRSNTLDHFPAKLLHLEQTMQTASGRREARRRTEFLRVFLQQLEGEIADGGEIEISPGPGSGG